MPEQKQFHIGLIGLGVMGRNLALNMEDKGFPVAVWNRRSEAITEFLAQNRDRRFGGDPDLARFVAMLERPRRILLMIKAGDPVDQVIERLIPLLEPGDIIMDGGNSWFEDTRRRERYLRDKGLHFVGVGISGGEEGARLGPSMMPGGSRESYGEVSPVFEAITAQTEAGSCVTHVGPDGAGHFVKMVHNGIEYADMQLLAEAYDLMGRGLGLNESEMAEQFEQWNQGPMESFLVELTARVMKAVDSESGTPLVNLVMDKAGQKGTGRWTVQAALEEGVAVPGIAAAVDARLLSSMKEQRVAASRLLQGPTLKPPAEMEYLLADLHGAIYASRITAYAQGLDLIQGASHRYDWSIDLAEIARIWKGGCIIRARLLDPIREAYAKDQRPRNLMVDPALGSQLQGLQGAWRRVLGFSTIAGIPVPVMSACLNYFDSYRTERLPQNLTQAQRDAFGAHTYERLDHPEWGFVHSEW
ncbi:MAG: NADP-dependent phosphogluconate dehydrogenase [Candidatus Thiodiazotropha sp.]|nr:NADP-dependent phosphogluconate dehydrogenase [Candidatus Thiodiazotropha taylori]MBT3058480.1 NADP-dependent phosphogluconate dehydrogenase [Candidatus Thiodiazotropha sp. (ex Lucina pensylvanica)]MBT3063395.1 NADP-dependent phosphogluconate dehydrogenase [Candidatus Thiodiazotropha sp. (ex Lucina pensylvanica)]PUB75602.1 MAG: phosphogluconate dehydrogenase (NADP(+)-dependent, decarboxylating) [gamma proteobacterium symbiont of Ctena orbiculata]PUB77083.1 MAG: phosphogluconate dehydrogenase